MNKQMTNEHADYLRKLYRKHVQHPEGHWKGAAIAVVSLEVANDVAEAMDFHGSLVDDRYTENGKTILISAGYWAHGF